MRGEDIGVDALVRVCVLLRVCVLFVTILQALSINILVPVVIRRHIDAVRERLRKHLYLVWVPWEGRPTIILATALLIRLGRRHTALNLVHGVIHQTRPEVLEAVVIELIFLLLGQRRLMNGRVLVLLDHHGLGVFLDWRPAVLDVFADLGNYFVVECLP